MKILNLLILIALIYSASCFQSSLKISNTVWAQQIAARVASANFDTAAMKAADEDEGKCIQPDFLSEDKFQIFLSNLKGKTPEEMVKLIPQMLKENGKEMLSPRNSVRFFTEVDYGEKLDEILIIIREYLWLNSKDLRILISKIRSLDDRVKFLLKLFPMIIDHNKINLDILRDQLDCGHKGILDKLKLEFRPKDCFFGDLSGDNVFVIDLSGSMMFGFMYKNKYYTRLSFLKELFKRAITNMTPEQKFQIVTFSTKARYLTGDNKTMVPATSENKKKFVAMVEALEVGWGADGYTNLSEAVRLPLEVQQKFDRVIFFSDGGPTRGIVNYKQLKKWIETYENKRNALGKIPININMLMLGGTESARFRKNAKIYAKLIAATSNGVVKNYDSKMG